MKYTPADLSKMFPSFRFYYFYVNGKGISFENYVWHCEIHKFEVIPEKKEVIIYFTAPLC